MESFNGKIRDELLDREIFHRLKEVQVLTNLQPHQATQLAGLQTAGTTGSPVSGARPNACRTNIAGGTKIGGRSPTPFMSCER